MNTCKNEQCNNEPKGSSVYCSDSCKTVYNRNKSRNSSAVTPAVTAVTSSAVTTGYVEAEGQVYNRQAVRYLAGQWETRPMPLSQDDQPHSGGRGKYTRQDGTVYQFDSSGRAFNVTNGKVYQSIEEVKARYV